MIYQCKTIRNPSLWLIIFFSLALLGGEYGEVGVSYWKFLGFSNEENLCIFVL